MQYNIYLNVQASTSREGKKNGTTVTEVKRTVLLSVCAATEDICPFVY